MSIIIIDGFFLLCMCLIEHIEFVAFICKINDNYKHLIQSFLASYNITYISLVYGALFPVIFSHKAV